MGHYDALVVIDDIFCFWGEVGMPFKCFTCWNIFLKSSVIEVDLIITTK
jgi:hypothetical protein